MECGTLAQIISSCEGPGSLSHCSKLVADKNDGCNTMSEPLEPFFDPLPLYFILRFQMIGL